GRMVSVVFRASPLIWPTSFGANPAPRYLFCCTPGGFPRGAIHAAPLSDGERGEDHSTWNTFPAAYASAKAAFA
ncbi:MAG: hypothetical protein O9270_05205, partial [Aquidulcibacter sp.]|uniref:hypothetical protein n=1 Tax=Aquidulcibacter sp. TaxID=2052990 RepID=UPI0022CCF101